MEQNEMKKACGYAVVDQCVSSGMKVGMGTGSTAYYAIERLAWHLQNGTLQNVVAVATSFSTQSVCQEKGIPVFSLNDSRIDGWLDCAIDGADEVNPSNQLIKGGGAAHLLEKVVEYSADDFYVIVDESKLVDVLNRRFPVPLEIIPESRRAVTRRLEQTGFSAELRMAKAKAGPVITDSGNQILDIYTADGQGMAAGGDYDPLRMEQFLNTIPGVVESGLFTRSVSRVFIGTPDGIQTRG